MDCSPGRAPSGRRRLFPFVVAGLLASASLVVWSLPVSAQQSEVNPNIRFRSLSQPQPYMMSGGLIPHRGGTRMGGPVVIDSSTTSGNRHQAAAVAPSPRQQTASHGTGPRSYGAGRRIPDRGMSGNPAGTSFQAPLIQPRFYTPASHQAPIVISSAGTTGFGDGTGSPLSARRSYGLKPPPPSNPRSRLDIDSRSAYAAGVSGSRAESGLGAVAPGVLVISGAGAAPSQGSRSLTGGNYAIWQPQPRPQTAWASGAGKARSQFTGEDNPQIARVQTPEVLVISSDTVAPERSSQVHVQVPGSQAKPAPALKTATSSAPATPKQPSQPEPERDQPALPSTPPRQPRPPETQPVADTSGQDDKATPQAGGKPDDSSSETRIAGVTGSTRIDEARAAAADSLPETPDQPPSEAMSDATPAASDSEIAAVTEASEVPAAAPTPRETETSAPPRSDGGGGFLTRILFEANDEELSETARNKLVDVAEHMRQNERERVALMSFAAGGTEEDSAARRLSLTRALEVRRFLMEQDIRSTRVDVRAKGNQGNSDPRDRVDIVIVR